MKIKSKETLKDFFTQSLFFIVTFIFFSKCSQGGQQVINEKIAADTLKYPHVTILAELAENNKPKQIFLEKKQKPITTAVSLNDKRINPEDATNSSKNEQPYSPKVYLFNKNITVEPVAAEAQGKGFFTTYTTDNALALDQIYCSYKDKKGNLWFGTSGGGVSEYDGKKFTNYTTANGLANNIVWCIVEDHSGNIWFGMDGNGVSKYNGKSFTNYTTAQGLANDVVYCIIEDKIGNLWFGTSGGGVSKYDGKGFTSYTTTQGLANNKVRDILEDRQGNLWFATLGGGVSKYDGKSFVNFTTAQGLPGNEVRSIIQDKKGDLWFGTVGGGVSKYNREEFTNYTTKQGIASDVIWCITEDKSGNLWFGTEGGGASKYDGKSFTNYSTTQGLANNEVRCITEDKTGNLWFGTFGGGISKYVGKSFTNYTTTQGLAYNIVYSITEEKTGTLWFGTSGGGVSKYDGKSFTNYTTAQGLANNVIYCIAKDKMGNLWFGTQGNGVSEFDGKKFTNYTTAQGLANNIVFSIAEDNLGNLWFGTSGSGVSKFDGKSFTNYTTAQGLASNDVYNITLDSKGNLWFGTYGGGVSKYDGKSFTNYTTAQGLSNDEVWNITEDKTGNLWFGTQQGLCLLRNETLLNLEEKVNKKEIITHPIFETFTTKDGLPDNFVTQVVEGDNNKIYIGTNLGICELTHENSKSSDETKWFVGKVFNSLTGYPVKDVNVGPGAMYKDSSGIIWIGTGSDKTGLVRFDPKSIADSNQHAPLVVIQSVKINNENICWNDLKSNQAPEKLLSNETAPNTTEEVNTFKRQLSDAERDSMRRKFANVSFDSIGKWYPIPQNLILPHHNNNISFDFNANETGRNFLVKYQYMLQGYDKYWSPPSTNGSASFGNMFEGSYTFKIKAQSPDGVWSEPVSYTFKVLPPWWRTWWMYCLYLILITMLVWLLVRWNSRRIISQKKILEHKIKVATLQIREEKEKVETQKKKVEETLIELETTQTQLIQSEKMASLGELTAGIAHEIQNPLNFVNNFSEVSSELLDEMNIELDKGDINEAKAIANDVKQNLERINHHGKRADSIVKSMLEHSRSGAGKLEPTNINTLAAEYLRLSYHVLSAKDNSFYTSLHTNFDETIEDLNIIPQEIGKVLLNLYNNAFYTVVEKKKMLGENYEPTISVTTNQTGDKVVISVKDNGQGIPQKVLDKIFQPFFSTKPTGQGTGLGLSLSYDIIKSHRGEIKVETEEGAGTTFIIQLPAN